MTFSIVARSDDGAYLGVATATRSLAVGGIVPAAAPAVGALVTQARTNRSFRARGLALLREGRAPADVLAVLRREDPGFDQRQLALVDDAGRTAHWTGPRCLPWAGARSGPQVAVAGNLLVGAAVLEDMLTAYVATTAETFERRLLAALRAGDAAGGDSRGRQSAALYVVGGVASEAWPPVPVADLRVDDHTDPVRELTRLLGLLEAQRDHGAAGAEARAAEPEGSSR